MSYTKQTWQAGDEITSAKLNHLEDGINSVAGEVAELTEIVENNSSSDENPFAWTEKLSEEDLEYPIIDCTCTERYNSEPNEDGTYAFITSTNTYGLSNTLFVKYKYSNEEWINNETEREILTSNYTLTGIYIESEKTIVYGAKQVKDSEGNYSYTFDDNVPFMIKIFKYPRQIGDNCQVTFIWKGKYTQGFTYYYINNNIKEIKPEFSNAIDDYYYSTLNNMIIKQTFGLDDIQQRNYVQSKLTRIEILNKDNVYIGIYTGTLHIIPYIFNEITYITGTNDPDWEMLYSFYPIQKIFLNDLLYIDDLSYTFYSESANGSKLIITKSAYNSTQLILNIRLELVQNDNNFSEYYEIQTSPIEQFNFSNSLTKLLSTVDFSKILCGNYYHDPVIKIREYEIENSSYNFSSEIIDGYSYSVLTCTFPFSAISSFKNIYVHTNNQYQGHSMHKLNLNNTTPSKYSTYFNIDSGINANIILKTDSKSSICTLTIKALLGHNPQFQSNSISLAQMDETSFDSIRKPFQDAIKLILNKENITSNAPLIVNLNMNQNNQEVLDKTFIEIKTAFNSGRQVIIKHDEQTTSAVMYFQQTISPLSIRDLFDTFYAEDENSYPIRFID